MHTYLAFVLATCLILVIPGPTIILVVSQAVTHGRRSVMPLVIGVLLGDFTAMTFSLLGLGALMTASAALFSLFKWVGALYLLYLGVKMWRSEPAPPTGKARMERARPMELLRRSFIVTALNPKSIAFFVAFLPQFIEPTHPAMPQMLLLGTTFLVLATLNAALYALFASQLNERMQRPSVRRWFNRTGGTALVGAGLFTASMQRTG